MLDAGENRDLCVLMSCDSLLHARVAKNDMLKLAERRIATQQTHCAAMLENIESCVLMPGASLSRTRVATIDVHKLARSLPAHLTPETSHL